jgi:hypothetical protein
MTEISNAHLKDSLHTFWTICTHCNFRCQFQASIYTMDKAILCQNCKKSFTPFATSQHASPSFVPFGASKVAPMQAPPKPSHHTNGNVFAANQVPNLSEFLKQNASKLSSMTECLKKNSSYISSMNAHLKASQQIFWTICTHCNFRFQVYTYNFNKATICLKCKKSFVALTSYQAAPSSVPFGAPKGSPMQAPPKPASKSNGGTPLDGGCADTFVRSYPSCMKTCANGVGKQHKDEKSNDGYVPVSKPTESQSSNNVGSKRVIQPEKNEDDNYADISSKKPRQNESLNNEVE